MMVSPYLKCPSLFEIYPLISENLPFFHRLTIRVFRFPSSLTMMHFCITHCAHWTPLVLQAKDVVHAHSLSSCSCLFCQTGSISEVFSTYYCTLGQKDTIEKSGVV